MRKPICIFLLSLFTSLGLLSQTQLHLYGGPDHKVYLGCVNCNKYDSNSIWNAYGSYGSKYNPNSIWNAYGTYGSKFNTLSPWNSHSTNPPVVVDKEGKFYGYFTLNQRMPKRADFKLALIIYEYHEFIKDDVSKWYDKIFQ